MPTIPAPPAAVVKSFLASTRLLSGLADATLDEVARGLEWLLVPGGQPVCRQGEAGDAFYFVYSGRLAVVREVPGAEDALLGEVGRGDVVGELAVVTGQRRSATVRALRDVTVARLSRADADLLFERHPRVLLAITRTIAGWLQPSAPPRSRSCLAVAVVPVGEVPLPEFVRGLVRALSALGETLHLSQATVDERFGTGASLCSDGSSPHERMTAWINEQEGRCRFMVYEAGPAALNWLRRCLRQADRILLVAAGRSEPSLGTLDEELSRLERDQGRQIEDLALLHEDHGGSPSSTARWLGLRAFRRHHHLRLRDPEFARLARFIDGTAVGLVLGGGGARGFAHIGVIRALEEAGVPIDRIGGTSMGAVVAGMYARGCEWRKIMELNRWGWVGMKVHKVYTLPLISLVSPIKAETMLTRMYGDDHIEDLWMDFFCVSTNLTRTEVVVHRQGSLKRAIKASMTLPGITPPMVGPSGDLLVDGGVLNNLPTDVMARLAEGPIIAVDVSANVDLQAHPSYTDSPSPWQLLGDLLRGRARQRPFPNILRLIHRSALLASDVYAKQAKGDVELYLDLPMDDFDMFEMEAIDRIVEFGYEFARKALREKPFGAAPARP